MKNLYFDMYHKILLPNLDFKMFLFVKFKSETKLFHLKIIEYSKLIIN